MEYLKQCFTRKLVTLKYSLAVTATFEIEKTVLKLGVLISYMFYLQCSRSCCIEYSGAQKRNLTVLCSFYCLLQLC